MVGHLPEVMKAAEKAFSIIYKKEVDWNKMVDYGATEQCSLILMAKETKLGETSSYDIWSDGINSLLQNSMADANGCRSKTFSSDLESLLQLEMRMSLLNPNDTFNFQSLPKVPPPPTNFNFVNYKLCPQTKRIIPKEISVDNLQTNLQKLILS